MIPLTTIVIIDDNRHTREGLSQMIRSQPGFMILSASGDIDEAMRVVKQAKPDVVLVDFVLGSSDSLLLTRSLCSDVPETKVVVMGAVAVQDDISEFVRAGASGFVMKTATFEELLETIRRVVNGAKVLPPELTKPLFHQVTTRAVHRVGVTSLSPVRLTPRERQVADLIGVGLSNKEIAARLHVAVHTVKSHVHNVLGKLELHTRLEVAVFTRTDAALPANERVEVEAPSLAATGIGES